MRFALTLAALAASAAGQAVTDLIVPSSKPIPGCLNSHPTEFKVTIYSVGNDTAAPSPGASVSATPSAAAPAGKRSLGMLRRQGGDLTVSLLGGIMEDAFNRKAYIASNYQFQFDNPPQAGAIYTAGWSICSNGTIALAGQTVFWQCLSGSFYNLYDRNWAPHCYPVYFGAIDGNKGAFSTAPPGPERTGPSEATIANGGGTQSMNSTATGGIGSSPTDSSSAATTASDSPSGSGSGAGSAGQTATSTGGAVAAMATDAPQALLAWAAGIMGALAMI